MVPLTQIHAGSSPGSAGIQDKAASTGGQTGGPDSNSTYKKTPWMRHTCEAVHILVRIQERPKRQLEQKSKICHTALKVLEATIWFQHGPEN